MYEVDEVGGGSGGSGGCPYESPMYESPIHKRTPRAGSMAVKQAAVRTLKITPNPKKIVEKKGARDDHAGSQVRVIFGLRKSQVKSSQV